MRNKIITIINGMIKNSHFTKQVFKFVATNKLLFTTIMAVYLILLFKSLLLPKDQIFLAGEYFFSLDYAGHVKNILSEYATDNTKLFENTSCIDCPDMYAYSRWYSFIKFSFLSLHSFILLHPLLGYLFFSFTLQAASLYFFIKALQNRVETLSYLTALTVFIAIPYKFILYASGSLYSFHHSFMVSTITILIYLYRAISKKFSKAYIAKLSLILGIICSFFLNISINYLPIVIYGSLLILLLYIRHVKNHLKEWLLVLLISGSVVGLINFPMVLSLLKTETVYNFVNFISLDLSNAISMQWFLSNGSAVSALLFFSIHAVLFIIAKISLKIKSILILIYFITFILLLGDNSPFKIYRFVFENFPLMSSIRSLHRFIFFELIIVVLITYLGLKTLSTTPKRRLIQVIISTSIIFILMHHIYINRNIFFTTKLPQEYFDAAEYLDSLPGNKLYFPAYMPYHGSIPNNFNWSNNGYSQTNIISKNPFSWLLQLDNLIQFEKFPNISPNMQSIRYVVNYSHPPETIIRGLSYHNIDYIVVDNNYFWDKNFPDFDITGLVDKSNHVKSFGNIEVLKNTRTGNCKDTYGDLPIGYCVGSDYPKYLTNRSEFEYLLETNRFNLRNSFNTNPESRSSKIILDTNIREQIIENSVLIPDTTIFILDNTQHLYSAKVNKGVYYLGMLVFEDKNLEGNFIKFETKDWSKNIHINKTGHFKWYFTKIILSKDDTIKIYGYNSLTLGASPVIITSKELKKYNKNVSDNNYSPIILNYE